MRKDKDGRLVPTIFSVAMRIAIMVIPVILLAAFMWLDGGMTKLEIVLLLLVAWLTAATIMDVLRSSR